MTSIPSAAAPYNPGSLLTRSGAWTAQNLTTGATYVADVYVGGDAILYVSAMIAAAGAAGDVQVDVFPFASDNTTPILESLQPSSASGPDLVSGSAIYIAHYDVAAISKVRIQVTNNNAGTKSLSQFEWRLA